VTLWELTPEALVLGLDEKWEVGTRVGCQGRQAWDSSRDNVDVEVTFDDGRRFGATFFTLQNIEKLFHKNRTTGECAGGLYLWAANMILVRALSMEVIETTVRDLLQNEEFDAAFARLDG